MGAALVAKITKLSCAPRYEAGAIIPFHFKPIEVTMLRCHHDRHRSENSRSEDVAAVKDNTDGRRA
jgi:hypothetical protein